MVNGQKINNPVHKMKAFRNKILNVFVGNTLSMYWLNKYFDPSHGL